MEKKKLKLLVLKMLYNLSYQCLSVVTRTNKRAVLVSNRSATLSGNLKALHKEFMDEQQFEVSVYLFQFERSFIGRLLYFLKSFKVLYYLASSRVFIIDDYLFPIYCINKKPDNTIIQVWHAAGTLKKIGLSIPRNRDDIVTPHCNYDWVIVNQVDDQEAYMEAFNIPRKKILPLPMPKLKEISKLTKDVKQKQLLYAPTYRIQNEAAFSEKITKFAEVVTSQLPDWELVISLHPYVKRTIYFNDSNRIKIISTPQSIEDYYPTAAILITDYSAAIFEYSFFEQPILLYVPDLELYQEDPGFYLDIKEYLKAPMFKDLSELVNYIKESDQLYKLDYVKRIKKNIYREELEVQSANISKLCKRIMYDVTQGN